MAQVGMKELLEAGVHFGHQTRRWNPKMKDYIFIERSGIYIIDLQQTLKCIETATEKIREIAREGGKVLFVGTKKQAKETIAEEATRCGMFHVSERWLGGMLTNFRTIRSNIKRLKELEQMSTDGTYQKLSKKEVAQLEKQRQKLEKIFNGIKELDSLPKLVFVIDTKKEKIAVAEATKLKIPIVGIVDTNCDPEVVTHPIPGNDDAIRAIKLFCRIVSDSVVRGLQEAKEGEDSAFVEPGAAAEAAAPEGEVKEEPQAEDASKDEVGPDEGPGEGDSDRRTDSRRAQKPRRAEDQDED
ncbi:MAG: 30S ribosomal protein S2 [Candidatus Eiseniibacteriota bacterium]|nr:MAG: 30S ribosomal protein S2 [Candidatus Eisenbacteria bacterium]